MKVLFMTSTFPRFANDLQAPFVREQAQAWKKARSDDDVIVLAPHDNGAPTYENIEGVAVHRFRYMVPERLQALAYPAILPNIKRNPLLAGQVLPFVWAEYSAAIKLIESQGVDAIYAHWVMPQGVVAWRLSARTGVPYAVQTHSSDLRVFSKFGYLGKQLARRVLRDSRCFFCVNQWQRNDALVLFGSAERAEIEAKTTVLPMGVNMDRAGYEGAIDDKDGSIEFSVGMISRLSRKKGVDLFIRAVERVLANGLAVCVGIAGDGEDRERLMRMTDDERIQFLGVVSGLEKSRFFGRTRFMVFPSVSAGDDVEGLPVALLEALYLGKVVAASHDTNIEMLPEWDRIRDDVFLVEDPRDTAAFSAVLERMLALEHAEVQRRSRHLRETMSRYHWSSLIREYQTALLSRAFPA